MTTFFSATNPSRTTIIQANITTPHQQTHQNLRSPQVQPAATSSNSDTENRRNFLSKILLSVGAGSALLSLGPGTPIALAESWGTRSFLWEHFFEPRLSPEDSVARMKNTAEGLHSLRHMLETQSWRYVIFYIRLKEAYLKQDMQAALSMVPEGNKQSYIETANELVDNMAELDYYVRTPKIYESYVFYEKTLKSLDNLVAYLA